MTYPEVAEVLCCLNWEHSVEPIAFAPYAAHAPDGTAAVLVLDYRGPDGRGEPHPALALADDSDQVLVLKILLVTREALDGPPEDYDRRELPCGHRGSWIVPSERVRSWKGHPVS